MPLMSREFIEWAVELEEGVNVSAGSGTQMNGLPSRPEDVPVEPPAANGGRTEPQAAPHRTKRVGRPMNRTGKHPLHSEN